MNIFDKRPLSLILCIWLGGFVFFSTGTPLIRAITLIASVALIAVYLLLLIRNIRKHIILASSIALLLSVIASQVVFGVIYNPTDRFNGENNITGSVTEISRSTYSASVILKTQSVGDEKYQNRRVLLRLSSNEAKSISIGDTLTVSGVFRDFENDGDFDAKSYYFSDSVCAEISDVTNIEIEPSSKETLSSWLAHAREYLRRRAVMFSNSESGSMVAALLFGERNALSEQTRLNFTRIGISHLLALSGLHLAIICIGLSKLLSLLRINKKLRYAISIVFVLAYMTFTGLSVSVVRAGIMLIVAEALFLISKTHDSVTSLVLSVFIICIVSPFSIYDVSLWLSAFATLGLLALYDTIAQERTDENITYAIGKYLLFSILSSIFAILATILISTLTFNTISVIAPLSTLIFSLLAEIVMWLGGITLIIGGILPIGKLLIPTVEVMSTLAEHFARPRWIYVSTDYGLIKALVLIITVLFVIFVVTNTKRKRQYIILLVALFIGTSIFAVIKSEINYSKTDVIYSSANQSDILLIKSNSEVCLINSSNFGKNSATKAKRILSDERITEIDKYVVTGYTWNLSDDICSLLSSVKTKNVFLPTPRSDDEADILEMLFARISEFDTSLIIYNNEDPIICGDFTIHRDYASLYGDKRLCAVRIYNTDTIYTYLSSGMTECADYPVSENISTSDVVLYGSYGQKCKESYIDCFYAENKIIVLNTENIIFDENTYSMYKENGCEIYPHPSELSILIEN